MSKTKIDPAAMAILADLPEWMFDVLSRQCAAEALIETLLLIMLSCVAPTARREFLNDLFALLAEVRPPSGDDQTTQFAADLAAGTNLHIKRIIDQAVARLAASSVGVAKN